MVDAPLGMRSIGPIIGLLGRVATAPFARPVGLFCVVWGGYAAGSHVSYAWFNAGGLGASFFPSAGVTLAALLLTERRRWWIVLLGAGTAEASMDVLHGVGGWAIVGYVAANLVEPLTGASLVAWRLGGVVDLRRLRDLLAFSVFAVVAAPAAGSLIGATTFVLAEGQGWARFAGEWWVGDGLAVLVVGGPLLAIAAAARRGRVRRVSLDAVLLAAAVLASSVVVFWLDTPVAGFATVAAVIGLALRCGTTWVAVGGSAAAFVAAQSTAEGHAFWEGLSLSDSAGLVYLQLLLALVVGAALVIAAALWSRDEATQELARVVRSRLTAELDVAFARATTVGEVADVVAAHASATLAAARTALALALTQAEPPTIQLVPRPSAAQAWTQLASAPMLDAVAAGRVQVCGQGELRSRYPSLAGLVAADELAAFAGLGFTGAAGMRGAVGVAFRHQRTLSPEEWEKLELLADRAARAVERVRSHEQELQARRRTEALQRVGASLAGAATSEAIADIVFEVGLVEFGMVACQLFLPDVAGLCVISRSRPGQQSTSAMDASAAPQPARRVMASGSEVWYRSRDELGSACDGTPAGIDPSGQASGWIPLELGPRRGCLAAQFDASVELVVADRALVGAVARLAGQALERAQLHADEVRSRVRAERSEERLRRLQALTAALAWMPASRLEAEISHELRAATGARNVRVYVAQEGSRTLVRYDRDGDDHAPQETVPASSEHPAALAAWAREPQVFDQRSLAGRVSGLDDAPADGFVVGVPLAGESDEAGCLLLLFDEPVTEDDPDDGHRFLGLLAGQVRNALTRVRFLTEDDRRRRRAEALQALASSLAAAATADAIAQHVVEVGAAAVGADFALLALVDEAEQTLVPTFGPGLPGDVGERWHAIPLDMAAPPSEAYRRRWPVIVESLEACANAYPGLVDDMRRAGHGSTAALPLISSAGHALGALSFSWLHELAVGDDELGQMDVVAELCGQALERSALLTGERDARQRAEALRGIAGRLTRSESAEAVARALLEPGLSPLGTSVGVVALLDREGTGLEVAAAKGFTEEIERSLARFPLTAALPIAEAARDNQLVVVASPEERDRRYPDVAGIRTDPDGAFVALPLSSDSNVVGAFGVTLAHTGEPTAVELRYLGTLAEQASLALARVALTEAQQRARGRAELTTQVLAELERVRGLRERAGRLLELLVPRVADYATVELPGEQGGLLAVAHRDQRKRQVLRTLRERHALRPDEANSLHRVAAGEDQLLSTISAETVAEYACDEETASLLAELGPRSHLAVPLAIGEQRAALMLGLVDPERRPYDRHDLAFVRELSSYVGLSLANARVQEHEHAVAMRLQAALLPRALAKRPPIDIAARYSAGSELLTVGGDWYDVFDLPDGRIGICVGDVVGHGLDSAVAMGRVRAAAAALAPEAATPGALLDRLDRYWAGPDGAGFATACYAILNPAGNHLEYASAGHPPILAVYPDGESSWLDGGCSVPLLGLCQEARASASRPVPAGTLLVLFTDGLVERRGESLDLGLERLRRAAVESRGYAADSLCDRLLAALADESNQHDDIAIVCIRVQQVASSDFHYTLPALPEALAALRAALRAWAGNLALEPAQAQALQLVVGEACSNAVEHAYADDAPGTVAVHVEVRADRSCAVRVCDRGRWHDSRPNPDGGRGTEIMQRLCSDFTRTVDEQGTLVTMTIRPSAVTLV